MRSYYLFVLFFISVFVFGNKTDSLYQLYTQEKNYKIQIKYLNDIFNL